MSDVPAGLETLQFLYPGRTAVAPFAPVLVGVVGSGNLEVMLESDAGRDDCAVRVETSARGFSAIWQAVMDDFHARHPLGGLRVSINDMGATPAVVSLRLDQAVAEIAERAAGLADATNPGDRP
jgi:malonate decarboxylase delta subunit